MNDIYLVVDAFAKDGSIHELIIRKSAIISFTRNGKYINRLPEDCTIIYTENPDLTFGIDIPYDQFKKAFNYIPFKKEEEN